ncbi:MAG: hypothetical protein IRY86_10150 [Thermorudis peleae]|nr:hypothetical protein [Thermorudis peleae]
MRKVTAPRPAPGAAAVRQRVVNARWHDTTCAASPGVLMLSAEIAALSDYQLVEHAQLLTVAAAHPRLQPLLVERLRVTAVELAARLAEVRR